MIVKGGGVVLSKLKYALLCFTAIVTFLCYSRTLHNTFTNWDDDVYLTDNPYVKSLTPANVKMLLLHNITNNYYHPITMLSLAANYHFSKMEPMGYYLTNVIMHVLNACLVFLLIIILLAGMEEKGYGTINGKEWLAAVGALLYGVHPMHVESVAWLAERKDLLYAFFYFLGLMAYVKYVKEQGIKWMICVVVFYLLSLLSKPQAIVFPLSLLAFDVLLKRKIDFKVFSEKLPIFIVSLGAAILTYKAQMSSGAVNAYMPFTLFQRALVPFYGFVMYIVKAFLPANLCAFYPYPALIAIGKSTRYILPNACNSTLYYFNASLYSL